MRKTKSRAADDDMRAEYDFIGAVRGKYYKRFRESSNVVVLEPDVAALFPNSASVNEALRGLASIARRSARVVQRAQGPPKQSNKRMHLTTSAKARRRSRRR